MIQHNMKLDSIYFDMIKNGTKTIELRLYDSKRRKINTGDIIVFTKNDGTLETVKTKVINLYVFDSFETLYQKLPLEKCGYTSENISSARAEDMEYYYTKPQQKKCGVIGIEISLLGE